MIKQVKRTSNLEELRDDPAFEWILKALNGMSQVAKGRQPGHLQDEPAQVYWAHSLKRVLGRAPQRKDRVATESIPMDKWVQELHIAQEEARKLILANIKSEQQD